MFRKKLNPTLPPEWLIVGLGNPGPEYKGTRHNLGFEVVEMLAEKHKAKFNQSKHSARYCRIEVEGVCALMIKPMTYMNLSGKSIAGFARAYNIPSERILVVTDDLDTPVGKVRMRPHGGHGGHNGHRNIIQALGTQEYPRLRIGIGKGDDDTIDHVLGGLTPHERGLIDPAIKACAEACEMILTEGTERTLSWINSLALG